MLKRLSSIALLVLAALTIWLRAPEPEIYAGSAVRLEAVEFASSTRNNIVTLEGLWKLLSRQPNFGSFSAMVSMPDGGLRLFSDYGYTLLLPELPPGNIVVSEPLSRIGEDTLVKSSRDIESATAHAGMVWLGFEGRNAISKADENMRLLETVTPTIMADWGNNSGAEAMARLADGSFLVLRENWLWWPSDYPIEGALFERDPTLGNEGRYIEIRGNESFRPVDMAKAPDGRLIVLMRKVTPGFRIHFHSRLAILDPADLSDGKARLRTVADLGGLIPSDNYEGLAVRANGASWDIWLVSDDNRSHYQSSWLAHLSIDPAAL